MERAGRSGPYSGKAQIMNLLTRNPANPPTWYRANGLFLQDMILEWQGFQRNEGQAAPFPSCVRRPTIAWNSTEINTIPEMLATAGQRVSG